MAGVGKAKRAGLQQEERAALHEYLVVDFALQVGLQLGSHAHGRVSFGRVGNVNNASQGTFVSRQEHFA